MTQNGFQIRPLHEGHDGFKRKRKKSGKRLIKCIAAKARGIGRNPRSSGGWKKYIKRGLIGIVLFLVLYFAFLWFTLPNVDDPTSLIASQSSVITDREGVELYRLFDEEDRTFVPGADIPLYMKQAMIAIEDERFYERGCLDVKAIARAILLMGRAGGGSTITRQLARNALGLLHENRYQRKIKEVILGCQLEQKFTKEELIDLYLNWIPFGRNAYGIEQASQLYFGIAAKDLTLAHSAVLAALPQRPSYFSPYGYHRYTEVSERVEAKILNGKITKSSQIPQADVTIGLLGGYAGTGTTMIYVGGRTDQVLRNMQEQGFITEQERLSALEELEELTFQPSRENIRAPHFVLWVRETVEEMFGEGMEEGLFEQGGLTIETTLDWELQQAAETVFEFHREDLFERYGAWNMALVAMDPKTREILTYVGNTDYSDEEHGGKIDMVHAARQPGSSFKPFVYAAAFQNGYSPATPIYDVPTKIGDDEPQNFDGEFMGLLTMRQAIGASRNIPAAKTFFLAGGEDVILNLLRDMGAPSPSERKVELAQEREDGFDYGWPLALGAAETPLLEMVQAYGTFASGGEAAPSVAIRRIKDRKGNILFESELEPDTEPVLDPRIAYQITSVLSDEWARPEGYWRTQLTVPGYQTAAKTGTSNKCLEWKNDGTCLLRKPDNAWLIGYTPHLVAGVWVGNADSSSMYEKGGGLNTASPVWRDYMMRAHRLIETTDALFEIPDGIVQPQVSLLSGQLPTECTPVHLRRADVFLEENAPTEMDPACQFLTVDKVTHLLASKECPKDAEEEGSFLVSQSLLPQRWPKWEEGVKSWVAEQMELWYADETHSGAVIPLPVAPTEECDPELTPGRLERPELAISFPQEGGIAGYPAFRPRLSYTIGSSIREILYEIDGKKVASVTSEPFDRTLRVPRSIKKSGMHKLSVTLIDEYFNQITKSVAFRFDEDKNDPVVHFVKPSRDITIDTGAELVMKAEARDPDGGIKYVQFYLDDMLLSTKPKEPFEMKYTVDLPDGVYQLCVFAEDFAKNRAEDCVKLSVGKGAPTTQISEPKLISPTSSSESLSVDEIIDVIVEVPTIGSDYTRLKIVITSDVTSGEEVLLELTEGEGIYKRPWKAERPGAYTIKLVTESRSGEVVEWATRTVTVQ